MADAQRQPAGTDSGSGYAAYSYLRAGEDFRAFELAPEFGRVPAYAAGLTAEQEDRTRRLLAQSLVISLHDHPVRFPLRMEETPEYNRAGRQHAAYAGLAASGMTVVFDNMMDGTACVTGNAPWRWEDIITDLGMRHADRERDRPPRRPLRPRPAPDRHRLLGRERARRRPVRDDRRRPDRARTPG